MFGKILNHLLFLFIFIIKSSIVFASTGTLISDQTPISPFILSDYKVSVQIKDKLSYTTVTQTYQNPTKNTHEGE